MPCSCAMPPLCHGVGARPAYAAICRRLEKCRDKPSDHSLVAPSAANPRNAVNILTPDAPSRLIAGRFGTRVEHHRRRRKENPVALLLHHLDLLKDQLKPVELAADLRFYILRQGSPVARAQFVKPLSAIAQERRVIGDPLREQKTLDAIDVAHPFGGQCVALT